jgi:uncharacterized HAD superfamily protein
MAAKPTIAIDVDDVLAANAEGFAKFSNERWGTSLTPDDYDEHWAEMWGVDHEEMMERRRQIVEQKVFTSYRFFDEAKDVLTKLAKKYRLVILTSRTADISDDTTDWVNSYFGELFANIH